MTTLNNLDSPYKPSIPGTDPTPIIGGVYEYFVPDDIVMGGRQTITEGFFTNNVGVLETFHTSSTQAVLSSSRYYLDIYQSNPLTDSGSEKQFDISYAKYGGITGDDWEDEYSAADAVYRQYANILLPAGQSTFAFAGNATGSGEIFIVNLKRDKLKEGLQAGYWQLNLEGNNEISLIDESKESDFTVISVGSGVGSAYYITSGSATAGRSDSATDWPYGIAYPDLGILILNADSITGSNGIDEAFTSTYTDGKNKDFYNAISASSYFYMRNEEEVHSTHYFVRAKNQKFNFSNNRTWVTGSGAVIKNQDMWNDPKVYITTVGLYNNSNELLATAKLSRPIQKSFERELLIKVRLDY